MVAFLVTIQGVYVQHQASPLRDVISIILKVFCRGMWCRRHEGGTESLNFLDDCPDVW